MQLQRNLFHKKSCLSEGFKHKQQLRANLPFAFIFGSIKNSMFPSGQAENFDNPIKLSSVTKIYCCLDNILSYPN